MAELQHIIERRVLDLTLPDNADADRVLEHDALDWADRFSTADVRLFDDISSGAETVVIDRLEVDLGTFTRDVDPGDLLELYQQEMASCLQEILDNTPPASNTVAHRQTTGPSAHRHTLFEAAAHFLEAGTLPDWLQPAPAAPTQTLGALAETVTNTARQSPNLIARWLPTADIAWPVVQRAMAQFGDIATASVLDALPSHVAERLLEITNASPTAEAAGLRALLELRVLGADARPQQTEAADTPWAANRPDAVLPGPDKADATGWPQPAAHEPAPGRTEHNPPPNGLSQNAEAGSKGLDPPAREASPQQAQINALQSAAGAPTGDAAAAQCPAPGEDEATGRTPPAKGKTSQASTAKAESKAFGHQAATPLMKDSPSSSPAQPEDGLKGEPSKDSRTGAPTEPHDKHKPLLPAEDNREDADHAVSQERTQATAEKLQAGRQAPDAPMSKTEPAAAPIPADDPLPWHRTQSSEAAALPVRNAGAVLLGPFLPTFFTRLEMLDNDGWRSPELAARAVHLVHYLACNETETPQYDLPLAMVICGLPFDTMLPKGITPTDTEQAQAKELLGAALGHWPQMAGTSIDGLRATFLMRGGLLSEDETCWRLRVEPGPFDILLDSLPWPYRTLMLSWMPKMLEVEW